MLNRVNAKIGTVLALSYAIEFGQTFEAADVQASQRATNPYTYASGGVLRGGRYDLRKVTMLDLIKQHGASIPTPSLADQTGWNSTASTSLPQRRPKRRRKPQLSLVLAQGLEKAMK